MLKISMSLGLTAFLFFFSPEVLAHTTVSATSTATGFWEQISTYDWTVDRNVLTEITEIKPGTTEQVQYSILATRSSPTVGPIQRGERGQVCVTNGGSDSTRALKIVNQLQYKSLTGTTWYSLSGASQTITPSVQLASGESRCFPYQVPKGTMFSSSSMYRNRASVTITNFTGQVGNIYGTVSLAQFSNPTFTNIQLDEALTGSETLTCPTGFTCTPVSFPLIITSSGTTNYSISVTNDSTEFCEFALANTSLALTEVDSLQAHQSLDQVLITTGKPPEVARLFATGNSAFGGHTTGSTTAATLYVINAGGASATSMNGTVTGDYFAFKGGTYPGTGGTCSSSLAIDAECTLEIEFNPDVEGEFSGLMTLNYNNGQAAASASRSLVGTGVNVGILTISDSPIYDFGNQPVGTPIDHLFTVSNTGDGTATNMFGDSLQAPFEFKGGSYPGTGGTCGNSLAGSSSCSIVIEFSPGQDGTFSDQIVINYFDGIEGQQISRSISGTSLNRLLSVGGAHMCATNSSGVLKCWGWNNNGQLGIGDSNERGDNANEMGSNLPVVNLGTGRSAKAIAAGGENTCAILDNDLVKCWGSNNQGQLGLGDLNNRGDQANEMGDSLPYVNLGSGRTVKMISAGSAHNCAILDNDSVKCWGRNEFGQLGLGDMNSRGDQSGEMGDNLLAINLGTGRSAKAIDLGERQTCVLLDNDTVKCWGYNSSGDLGQGDNENRGDQPNEMGDDLLPVNLGSGRTAKMVSIGSGHSCALLDNNSLKCWGSNGGVGKLGLGDNSHRGDQPNEMGDNLPAIDFGLGRSVKTVSAYKDHSCAILDNNSLKCWGWNIFGQLGYGDISDRGGNSGQMGDDLLPVSLGTGRSVAISSGGNGDSSCAFLDNGDLKCWGSNGAGQLGQGDTSNRGNEFGEMGSNLPPIQL